MLGEKSNEYFTLLRQYLSGRIDRDQLIRDVATIFPPDKMTHHDRFIGFIQGRGLVCYFLFYIGNTQNFGTYYSVLLQLKVSV